MKKQGKKQWVEERTIIWTLESWHINFSAHCWSGKQRLVEEIKTFQSFHLVVLLSAHHITAQRSRTASITYTELFLSGLHGSEIPGIPQCTHVCALVCACMLRSDVMTRGSEKRTRFCIQYIKTSNRKASRCHLYEHFPTSYFTGGKKKMRRLKKKKRPWRY